MADDNTTADPIADALALLKLDAQDLDAKSQAKDDADAAAAAATHAQQTAASDRAAAVAKQNADLDATHKLLDATFRVTA